MAAAAIWGEKHLNIKVFPRSFIEHKITARTSDSQLCLGPGEGTGALPVVRTASLPGGCPGFLPGRRCHLGRTRKAPREKRNSWLVNKRRSDVGEAELPWSPTFQAGWEPPANKFLFDAVKTPDHVSLGDGENPEKNTRKEGGSCPGTPQGSGLSGWTGSVAGAPCRGHLAASWRLKSPVLEINVSVSREPPASLHFFLVRVSLGSSALSPSPGDALAGHGSSSPSAPDRLGGEAGDAARPPIPSEKPVFPGRESGMWESREPWNANYPGRDECVIACTWQLLIER